MNILNKIFVSKFSIIFLLTFVNGLSMTMLFPVLPFIVKYYGEPEVILGILLATFSLFQFIATPILGTLSDKYGRKPVLLITQAGTFLSWIILAIAYFLPNIQIFGLFILPIFVIFLSRMFDGITGGNNSVAQAVIADLTETKDRAKMFGFNAAIFGMTLIVGPALGSLAMSSHYGYFGVAIFGAIISLATLGIMVFLFQETLDEQNRKGDLRISLKDLNIFSQVIKWGKIDTIRYTIIMKTFMFSAFVGYTSITTLYMIDIFGFKPESVGYYLTFTGSFLVVHQSLFIPHILKKIGDRKALLIALLCMGFGFIGMGFSKNVFIFTFIYFFTVLGISMSFTTIGALISRAVDEKNQGEIMGMGAGIESFISIGIPIIATLLYGIIPLQIYFIIGILPLLAFVVSKIFYGNIRFMK